MIGLLWTCRVKRSHASNLIAQLLRPTEAEPCILPWIGKLEYDFRPDIIIGRRTTSQQLLSGQLPAKQFEIETTMPVVLHFT